MDWGAVFDFLWRAVAVAVLVYAFLGAAINLLGVKGGAIGPKRKRRAYRRPPPADWHPDD